jgi:hypothetical protein
MAVFKLMYWALATQEEACEAVGKAARVVFGNAEKEAARKTAKIVLLMDQDCVAGFRPDNIRKSFYEPWLKKENNTRKERGWPPLPRIKDYTKESRYKQAPNKFDSVESLAEQLLRHGGLLPYEDEASSVLRHLPLDRTRRARLLYEDWGLPVRILDPDEVPPDAIIHTDRVKNRAILRVIRDVHSKPKSKVKK